MPFGRWRMPFSRSMLDSHCPGMDFDACVIREVKADLAEIRKK
jgi:hypothetical protein